MEDKSKSYNPLQPLGMAADERLNEALLNLSAAEEANSKAWETYTAWTHCVDVAKRNLSEAEARVASIIVQVNATLANLIAARKAVVSAAKESK